MPDLEWWQWFLILVVIIVILILIAIYWLRHSIEENFKQRGIDPASVDDYTGSWTPWGALKDVEILNRKACEEGFNPNITPETDPDTDTEIC